MVGLVGLSLAFARLQNGERSAGRIDPIGRTVLAVTSPVSVQLGRLLDLNGRFWSSVWESESLRRDNMRLRSMSKSWEQYQETVESLESQLNHLRGTIGMAALSGRKKVPADIISFDPVTSRVTLNAGSSQGITAGQAVVTGDGLVGQIQSVDRNRSQALLVSSPVLRLGAMIAGDPPVTGLMRGQGPRRLVFEIVESSRVFKQGELVVTSLHSERTPPNIPIGIVLNQEPAQEYGITRIIVIPTVDVGSIREVFVIQ